MFVPRSVLICFRKGNPDIIHANHASLHEKMSENKGRKKDRSLFERVPDKNMLGLKRERRCRTTDESK